MGNRTGIALIVAMFAVALGLDQLTLPGEAMQAAAREGWHRITAGEALQVRLGEILALVVIGVRIFLLPLLLMGAFLIIERLAGPRAREPKHYRAIWMAQLCFSFAAVIAYAGLKMAQFWSEPLIRVAGGEDAVSFLTITLPMYLLSLLVGDFCLYWLHRAMHAVPVLWKFHRVHHSPSDLDVLHNVIHPVELVTRLLFVTAPASLLIGVSLGGFYALTTVTVVVAGLQHMNVSVNFGRFGNLIVDNRYHFVHHSRAPECFNSNYAGMFPVLDMLFGTYRRPHPGPLPETGLGEEGAPTKFRHYLLASWPEGAQPSPRAADALTRVERAIDPVAQAQVAGP